jgi:hypothetical protein
MNNHASVHHHFNRHKLRSVSIVQKWRPHIPASDGILYKPYRQRMVDISYKRAPVKFRHAFFGLAFDLLAPTACSCYLPF